MDAKLKNEMENRISHLSEHLDYVKDHFANENLEEVEYYLDLMKDEIKGFLNNIINAYNMEE